MKLLTSKELAKAVNLNIPGGNLIAGALMQIFRYNKLNRVYSSVNEKDTSGMLSSMLEQLEIRYEVSEDDLENIPATGSFITVSNHPYGGIDALILVKILYERRPDLKVMANFLLQRIEPIKDIILPVNPFETHKEARSSFTGLKEGLAHLREGHCISIFPAGEVSTYQHDSNVILDREWNESALKFIMKAEVPVIPIYFHGTNSRLFHILGKIHPLLRTAKLPSELFNKRNRSIIVRVGKPITVKDQANFKDTARYGRYLRAKTYSLGTSLEVRKFYFNIFNRVSKKGVPVAGETPSDILTREFNEVRKEDELFTTRNYSVICAPTHRIPNIFTEIGRLRELTFRAVGEGTGKSTDIDEYDFYYHHLVIWDTDENRIVGAYRIGKGKEILSQYGLKGFYISSLFKIKKPMIPVLDDSLELGRSFITLEYQKKALPLFLLWKGIFFFLLKNAEYRYLIGPVSISNDMTHFSKSLIVDFIRTYFFRADLAKYIESRKRFILKPDKVVDRDIFIDDAERDISKLEKILRDIEPGYRLPVLLKKYIELNANIIGFNIDPKFNNCLDGLIILDLYEVPPDFIKALSKEFHDSSVKERFGFV
ncbi:MAG: lysophospholipid acyltransferase family protein [Bacteroidales bacterium]|jgi:putative hemolysin|nr:lysophospholipid acyltransferase family protein [Bacteroidales bacterium]